MCVVVPSVLFDSLIVVFHCHVITLLFLDVKTQPTQDPVPAEVANEPTDMELRSNYLPTTVGADNTYNGPPAAPPTTPPTVDTGNSTHSNPLNGYVTGDQKDVS